MSVVFQSEFDAYYADKIEYSAKLALGELPQDIVISQKYGSYVFLYVNVRYCLISYIN